MASHLKRAGSRLVVDDDTTGEDCFETNQLEWEDDNFTPDDVEDNDEDEEKNIIEVQPQFKQRKTSVRCVLQPHQPKKNLFSDINTNKCEGETIAVFNELADEIILYLFSFLTHSSLTRCVQVCKRWLRLGYDDSLWKEVVLDGKNITHGGVLGSILHRGVQIARLNKAEILAPVCLGDEDISVNQEKSFRLTQLDASLTKFSNDNLACLLFRCTSLKFLSLESCKVGLREITAISYNHELEVLNLALSIGLTPSAIDVMTRKCLKLRSINLSWTNQTRDSLRYICRCKDLEELNLSGLRGGVTRKVVEKLVHSCRKLVELDLSDVTLQIGTMKLIADNLTCLKKLSISRCSDVKPEQLMDLTKLTALSHLNLFGFINSNALERFCSIRPDIFINKETFSPIARPISTNSFEGRLWEQYSGFII